MHHDIERILLTEEQIQEKIAELGKILTEEYRDKNPIVVGVLKGVVIFYADMIRAMDIPCHHPLPDGFHVRVQLPGHRVHRPHTG